MLWEKKITYFYHQLQAVTSYTNAILHVIENAGHVVNVDQPIEFNSTAIKFIKFNNYFYSPLFLKARSFN